MGQKLNAARRMIEKIVCTEGEDRGVILLDHEGRSEYDEELKCHVYQCENFSPLGDALIALWELLQPDSEMPDSSGPIHGQWIPVSDQLPTHIYTVLMLVTDGPLYLHNGDGYVDVGIYNAERQQWQVNNGPDDVDVKVSHWMHLDRPGE